MIMQGTRYKTPDVKTTRGFKRQKLYYDRTR